MAWTSYDKQRDASLGAAIEDARLKAVELQTAIEEVAIHTGNHNERRRMELLEKDALEIYDTLTKIAAVRQRYLEGERS